MMNGKLVLLAGFVVCLWGAPTAQALSMQTHVDAQVDGSGVCIAVSGNGNPLIDQDNGLVIWVPTSSDQLGFGYRTQGGCQHPW